MNQSITELYARHYDLHYGRVRFEIVPTALSADAAAALQVSVGSPGLRIARVNYDQHERLIDCDLEFWRHDAIHVGVDVAVNLAAAGSAAALSEAVDVHAQRAQGEPLVGNAERPRHCGQSTAAANVHRWDGYAPRSVLAGDSRARRLHRWPRACRSSSRESPAPTVPRSPGRHASPALAGCG